MRKKSWIVVLLFGAGVFACTKDDIAAAFEGFAKPSHFPEPVYRFADNQVTQAGFELGRKLFYDTRLSRNNTISCGTCHIPTAAFTHHGHDVSHGIDDLLGTRNSPPIMNLAWSPAFMWDGGIFDLDLQPIAPITNHVEMDEKIANVLAKLKASTDYPALFQKAFGSNEITSARFMKVMSQFMVMCISSNAKYDSVQRGQASFSTAEQQGYTLVQQKCTPCHKEPLFTDYSFRNNGLPPSMLNDEGRYPVTLNAADKYKFKVPSLRNLAYTAPYMHDGRFYTLDAVLDHYTTQLQATPNIDPLLTQNGQLGIPLSNYERTAILAFLKTLDDKSFVTNTQLAEQ
jgi:cytochrome c peroxidase